MVPKAEGDQRISRLQERLRTQNVDGALFAHPVDLFYFSGTRQNGALWVPAAGNPLLLIRKSFSRASAESLIADVRPFPPSRELPSLLGNAVRRVGLAFDVMSLQYHEFYSNLLAGKEFVDISMINREIRSVKSPWEIDRLRSSGRLLAEVMSEVPTFLKPGIREIDLAAEIEYRLRRAGNEGPARMRGLGLDVVGLVAAGVSAASPGCHNGPVTGKGISCATPFGPSNETIGRDTPIIVDYAAVIEGYSVDMTRIFVFGDLDRTMKEAFAVSCEILAWIVEHLRPGASCEELYLHAVDMAYHAGLGEHFMGYPGEQARFVGHGVGLELDELPVLAKGMKSPLQAGQTIALEPKFIFPGQGVIGIENTYAVTPQGGKKLTPLPDDVVCL
jgi:Xaa-Pro aminopeptidase